MAREGERDDKNQPSDPRVAATGAIAGATVGALAVCIPMVVVLKNPAVAFVVVGGAALAIAGVWFSGRSKIEAAKQKQIASLESTIEELRERLDNVEVINRYEKTLAESELAELEDGRRREMGPPTEEGG